MASYCCLTATILEKRKNALRCVKNGVKTVYLTPQQAAVNVAVSASLLQKNASSITATGHCCNTSVIPVYSILV